MLPVPMMHSCRVRDPAQGYQNAQGQNRTHRFFLQGVCPARSIIAMMQRSKESRLLAPIRWLGRQWRLLCWSAPRSARGPTPPWWAVGVNAGFRWQARRDEPTSSTRLRLPQSSATPRPQRNCPRAPSAYPAGTGRSRLPRRSTAQAREYRRWSALAYQNPAGRRAPARSRGTACAANQIERLRITPTTAAVIALSAPASPVLPRRRSM